MSLQRASYASLTRWATRSASFGVGLDYLRQAWTGLFQRLPVGVRDYLSSSVQWLCIVPEAERWSMVSEPFASQPRWMGSDLDFASLAIQVEKAWAGVAPQDRRLSLLLPLEQGLVRELQLPQAARHGLQQLARYEIDRQTPFLADQVYADIQPMPNPDTPTASPGSLWARLAVLPRERVDPLVDQLAAQSLQIDRIDFIAGGRCCGFNLWPPTQRPTHPRPRRRLNGLLGLCLLVELGLFGQQIYQRQHQQLVARRAQLVSLQAQWQSMQKLQQSLIAQGQGEEFIRQQRQQSSTLLSMLQVLSQRLADDTYLQRISMDADGRLSMLGEAPQATVLLDKLKAVELWQQPSFQGSIIPDPASHKERFAISLQRKQPVATP